MDSNPFEIPVETLKKYERLKEILSGMKKVLIAFSGGIDSTFLIKVAQIVLKENILAVIASSETYPEREKEEAVSLCEQMGIRYRVIATFELDNPDFSRNSPQRCYFCKLELFSKLKEIASLEGIIHVLDGSNFDDVSDFRPGFKAAEELGIRSPLKEAELQKKEIRLLSRWLGLSTWNKPSLACLSSRFPYYTAIERENLKKVAQAEELLRALGFVQVRVRHHGEIARIELDRNDFNRILLPGVRNEVVGGLKRLGYFYVTLDLAGYRTGSMNEPLLFSSGKNGSPEKTRS